MIKVTTKISNLEPLNKEKIGLLVVGISDEFLSFFSFIP